MADTPDLGFEKPRFFAISFHRLNHVKHLDFIGENALFDKLPKGFEKTIKVAQNVAQIHGDKSVFASESESDRRFGDHINSKVGMVFFPITRPGKGWLNGCWLFHYHFELRFFCRYDTLVNAVNKIEHVQFLVEISWSGSFGCVLVD